MTNVLPGRYRHHKGKEYTVVGIARHSETLEELVVYRQEYGDHGLWVRPAAMFTETVLVEERRCRDLRSFVQDRETGTQPVRSSHAGDRKTGCIENGCRRRHCGSGCRCRVRSWVGTGTLRCVSQQTRSRDRRRCSLDDGPHVRTKVLYVRGRQPLRERFQRLRSTVSVTSG